MNYKSESIGAMLILTMSVSAVFAQTTDPLKNAVQQALAGNPDLTARLNAYKASVDAVDIARGGLFPRVDLSAGAGRDETRNTALTPEKNSINRSGATLSLTQLLWDGLGTVRDTERYGHERLARYFELIDATDQTALEAARAHYDVLRYRRLVQLAEDNYVQHRYATLQIGSRYRAGVGRGVDLEQSNARLALAESNLVAETSNLHDVTQRYQRIVGQLPPASLPMGAAVNTGIPATPEQVLQQAISRNAAISAGIESLRAARSAVSARESAYQPRLEARVRAGTGNNYEGVRDQRYGHTAEVVLNWNLFNGGSDRARVRQSVNLLNQATDLRDKACRDTRQTVTIAHNDTRKLAEQLQYLNRNTIAIEKARDAYRQQFDIGQRSLLDLLNAENELYTARRSYANAEYDLQIAYVRTQAALSQLTSSLGLSRAQTVPEDASGWSAQGDLPERCPVSMPEPRAASRAELDQRAQRMTEIAPPVNALTPKK